VGVACRRPAGSPETVDEMSWMSGAADRESFLAVYPRGTGHPQWSLFAHRRKPKWRDAPPGYSYLNATIGSTRDARRAGIQAALSAMTISTAASAPYVQGSVALNP
jgi:hypothetical protein